MDKVQTYLNFINIITYNYQFDTLTIHHIKPDEFFTPIKTNRIDIAVKPYIKAAISIEKLIMGIAF